jgi:DNA-binding NtrC family response regulator
LARVFLVGLDPATNAQISLALAERHHRVEERPEDLGPRDLLEADFIFAGGEPARYLPLLQRARSLRPTMPFIVIASVPATAEWLEALEAGATDYYSLPIDAGQLCGFVESVFPTFNQQKSARSHAGASAA